MNKIISENIDFFIKYLIVLEGKEDDYGCFHGILWGFLIVFK